MTEIIPYMGSCMTKALVEECGAQVNLQIVVEEYRSDDDSLVLGMCLEGSTTKCMAVKLKKLDTDVQASATAHSLHMYAVQDNVLKVPVGTKLVLTVGDDCTEEGRRETIGLAFDSQFAVLSTELVICGAARKARSNLKQVVLPNGTALNRDMSVRAVCAWLNKQNQLYASFFGVTQLVWCEERNNIRVFYHIDLKDWRKKPCGSVNNAIECMQGIICRDFFEDMRNEGDKYILD
jgi:hypothetical protein